MPLADLFDFFSHVRWMYRIGKFEYDVVTKWLESIEDDARRQRMEEAIQKYENVKVWCPHCHRGVDVLSLRAGEDSGLICARCDHESSTADWWDENPNFK